MAKKEAYYFSHDANAIDDPKCMLIIDQLGMEGYGIFWALIEKLRGEKDYKLPLNVLGSLARRWLTSKEKVEAIVRNYGLFVIDEFDFFFSARLVRSMEEKSEKARKSISYRWNNTNVLQSNNERNTNDIRNDTIKGKESKEKERKGKEIEYIFPTHTYEIELSEMDAGRASTYIAITKKVNLTPEQVHDLFAAFKTKAFTGAKSYRDNGEIISHFMETLKFEKFDHGTHKQTPGAVRRGKSAGAEDFLNESKEYFRAIRGTGSGS